MDRRTFLKGTSLAAAGSLLPLSGALALASGATNDDTVSTGKERVKSVEELMTRKTREVIDQGLRYLAHRQISEGNKRGLELRAMQPAWRSLRWQDLRFYATVQLQFRVHIKRILNFAPSSF